MTDADFLTNFLVRLGTTSTGIIVSALINFIIFPPNYMDPIKTSIPRHVKSTLQLTHQAVERSLTSESETGTSVLLRRLKQIQTSISQTMKLISYQQADYRYHRSSFKTMKETVKLQHILVSLQQIMHYIEGLLSYPSYRAAPETRKWLWEEWSKEFPRTAADDTPASLQLNPKWSHKDSHELFVICQIEALLAVIHKLPAEIVNKSELTDIITAPEPPTLP
jgi:hypothetical protein